ncbi:Lrp/AsnC family transcriptional regulator [Pedobacter nutrimenti]|jgi:DNA-binding Lrp family transcriptional regulator|uniref:DNA-binding Lrp family transcriptional regulator n=1 Tax=Pedobacter nutrimenti TaxID=1241337 RepID=A0A318UFA2_9SPHI|nr:Lrp/AsnC family transcriptional regulator [Pedobacter nutrimenti]PYF75036.1 DNA-binding Lrp family transcriptional regulator [Pedobacter nutrimenti]|eukprot:gene11881-13846_t
MNSTAEQSKSISLDAKDYEILKLLQKNAKLTIREIAAEVHLSPTPTHERIKRLEKTGVIKQYAAILDPEKINKGIMVICQISLRESNKKTAGEFLNAVLQFTEVTECYNISGDFDFMLKIVVESMESYHLFCLNKLGEVPGIGQTKSIFVMASLKETHLLI